MEYSERVEFANRLMSLLKKIIECKFFESTFIDKFLTEINSEFRSRHDSIPLMEELLLWLSETLQRWKQKSLSISETIFVCQFIGILLKYEQGFLSLQKTAFLDNLCTILQPVLFEKRALIPEYIKLLSSTLSHSLGYEWVKTSGQWKLVCRLYFSNSSLYVEREGLKFFKKLINKTTVNEEITEAVLQEIFLPVNEYNERNILDKNFYSYTLLLLKLLESLLKMNIFSENFLLCSKIMKIFDIQKFLNFVLVHSKDENVLVAASILQVLLFVANYENKKELLILEDIPFLLDIFYAMLRQKQFNSLLKLSKYCQVLWSEMGCEMKCKNKSGVHFIILQLIPVLLCIKPPDTALCDLYIQKLFSLTTVRAQKFCYQLRDEIRSNISSKPKDLALKGVLSVITNTECLNLEEAVIIFQAMVYTLKTFTENSCQGALVDKEKSLCIEDTNLLSAVINALCVFIEKFKINWSESLESLCLLKMTCTLLQNSDLSPIVVVQVLLLVKLTILNFMSPDLALLLNNTKDSAFDCLTPLLHKRIHDPKWEVRDSCLEVITAIAELSESKYPAFQQLLIEKNFYSLIVDVMEGDSESYVRASAIQALRAMTKIETLNQFLFEMEFPGKIIKLLQYESEGIVRREAALLIKQIYLTLNDPLDETVNSFYEIMGTLAISDLHWEVKVNSLIFWEAVIQRTMADQGMIDGSFPKVTFSKEHKKIVNFTKDEVKLSLDKVLTRLSKIGCLYVLLSTLNDDYDMPVVKKSAQVLSDLVNILKCYGVIEHKNNFFICDRSSVKRKNLIFNDCEKRKAANLVIRQNSTEILIEKTSDFNNKDPSNSDVVIDEIVSEMDFNLLVNVSSQKEETRNLQKKLLLEEIKPEAFILQMQNLNLEQFLEDKQKWLQNVEVDLKSLASEMSMANLVEETNIMDCY